MAVMVLMNARINGRQETRQRRRWMCLKGRIFGSSEFSRKPGFHLLSFKSLGPTNVNFYGLRTSMFWSWTATNYQNYSYQVFRHQSLFQHVFLFINRGCSPALNHDITSDYWDEGKNKSIHLFKCISVCKVFQKLSWLKKCSSLALINGLFQLQTAQHKVFTNWDSETQCFHLVLHCCIALPLHPGTLTRAPCTYLKGFSYSAKL